MMVRFMGRSLQTHQIKNKPIGEGYKLFVLTIYRGFVVNFTPDGRTAAKEGNQEYDTKNGEGKIASMILHVCEVIDRMTSAKITNLPEVDTTE